MEEEKEIDFEIVEEKKNHELTLEEEDKQLEEQQVGDGNVLRFLDSMDSYLILLDSLSATLRQGWLELASARHSMGASRLNSALLDLKLHTASTSLQVTLDHVDAMDDQPHFILSKWGSLNNGNCDLGDQVVKEEELQGNSDSLRYRGNSQLSEEVASPKQTSFKVDDQVQKGRSRSLNMFGTLVSPKLRAAQLSFETALETLVEIANIRSSLPSAFDKVQKELNVTKEMR